MSSILSSLEPQALWKHFNAICKVPHGSGNMGGIAGAITDIAKNKGLEVQVDSAMNVLVLVPATTGREKDSIATLQAHMDMVCEKNNSTDHDFLVDPIVPKRDGDWIVADGTTLGADDGIGIAAALAFTEDIGLSHGPLELLFTTDEEIGLVGAMAIEPGFFRGSNILSLDGEEEGVFWCGCAGGTDASVLLDVKRTEAPADFVAIEIKVNGLRGGHSGLDIHEKRGNAIKLVAQTLHEFSRRVQFELVEFRGGSKRNAIPRESHAVILVHKDSISEVEFACEQRLGEFNSIYGSLEPNAAIGCSICSSEQLPFDSRTKQGVIAAICALPHGVQGMSAELLDTVETSVNLAFVKTSEDAVFVQSSIRSMIPGALEQVATQIKSIAKLSQGAFFRDTAYPGWSPNSNSTLLLGAKQLWKDLFGTPATAKAIHGGLECGILLDKRPGAELVSFGPNIYNPHSPAEKVSISSVQRFFKFLCELVSSLR